jgi:DNA-binding MarR family transcriptional regulator
MARSTQDPGETAGGAPAAEAQGADAVGQLAELLFRTTMRLRRDSAKELAPIGVTFGQARVMRVLARADGPMRMADLATALEIVPRSVTTVIDSLEEAGLVCREPDPNDRRSVLVAPTASGQAALERMNRARRATAEDLFGRLSDRERATLLSLLVTLNAETGGAVTHVGAR